MAKFMTYSKSLDGYGACRGICDAMSTARPDRVLTTDEHGDHVLTNRGILPLYQQMQEAAHGRTPREVVQRVSRIDPTSLQLDPSQMVDLSQMPRDLMSAQAMLKRVDGIFDALPTDIKKVYDTNRNKFLKAFNDGSFVTTYGERLGLIKKEKPAVPPAVPPAAQPAAQPTAQPTAQEVK